MVVFNPKAPKPVLFCFVFFPPKSTEAELLFVIGQTDGFSEKNAFCPGAGSAALSPAAGSQRGFVLLIVSFWVGLGKTGLFFFPSLLNEPCVHGRGMGWGLKGAVFP